MSLLNSLVRSTLMSLSIFCVDVFIKVTFALSSYRCFQMFDQSFCCRQLRHSGLMDTAKIRSMGYPIRLTFTDFVYRYKILLPRTSAALKVTLQSKY